VDSKQQAFDSIDSAFKNPDLESSTLSVALFLGILVVSLILVIYFTQTRHLWRGRLVYLRKLFKGEAISKDRVKKNLELVIQMPYKDQPFRTRISNLSPNGMFVKMNPPLLVGESFRFLLVLGKDLHINAWAEVRWAQTEKTPHTSPGMGCKFFHLKDSDRLAIKKFLRR